METTHPDPSPAVAALNATATATLMGALLAPLIYPLGASIGLWHKMERIPSSCGDQPADFAIVGTVAAVGALVGLSVVAVQWRLGKYRAFGAVAADLLRFFLALTLFGYGASKVWATQFPHLWANLDTPASEMTPMRVAWQFFGYSRPYQQFLGWAEVVPALLLLPRRTATLGALLSIVVLANVFALNLFFDVCVKLNSGLFLATAVLIFLQDTSRLWRFFVRNQPLLPRRVATDWFATRRSRRRYRSLTGALAVGVLVLAGLDAADVRTYARSQQTTPLTGVWQPRRAQRWQAGRWQPLPPADSVFPTRLYLQDGQAVIRNGRFRDRFMSTEDSATHTLKLTERTESNGFRPPLTWRYARYGRADSLRLAGRWHGDSLQLLLIPARVGTAPQY